MRYLICPSCGNQTLGRDSGSLEDAPGTNWVCVQPDCGYTRFDPAR
jgi:predicted RNA-binding Zn-ribbon protein involved in translation (DUF1610 family)